MTTAIAAQEIAQQAFRYLELQELASFADGSAEATAAAQQYPVALEASLARADWSFASRLVSLPAIAEAAVDPDLPHAYQLPDDVLVLRKVGADGARWRKDGRVLRCDEAAPLAVRYTGTVTREAELPADFRDLVAYALAVMLSLRFSSSAGRKENLEAARERAYELAARSDRVQASSRRWDGRDEDVDWVFEAIR